MDFNPWRVAFLKGISSMKWAISIIVFACVLRVVFSAYTNFTAEDAHITFQFARNMARGDGFALNPGIPIYGSTTPLLTLLLAGWLLFSRDVVLGARLIDFLCVAGGMLFLYHAVPLKQAALFALLIMAVSARLIVEEMQGMEMPLLFLFMTGSLYGFMKGKPALTGIMAGLLLWSRVDAVMWVICLFIAYIVTNRLDALKFFAMVCVVYLPWVLFAWQYFGSPIPFTIIAKQVAYGIGIPFNLVHVSRIMDYLGFPILVAAVLSIFAIREKPYWIILLFFVLESVMLVFSGSTFFSRYFYLLTLAAYILIGFGLARLVDFHPGSLGPLAALVIIFLSVGGRSQTYSIVERFVTHKNIQLQSYGTLREMGQWINRNTPEDSTVLLEPLGYVGWYADRVMIDEVGLVTPQVVELHRQNISGSFFFQHFWPDYVIWLCEHEKGRDEISVYYDIVKVFDDIGNLKRVCYEVWMRRE